MTVFAAALTGAMPQTPSSITSAITEVASNHSHGVMQFDSNIAEALKVGDKVVLLRNYGGQEYLILGRL